LFSVGSAELKLSSVELSSNWMSTGPALKQDHFCRVVSSLQWRLLQDLSEFGLLSMFSGQHKKFVYDPRDRSFLYRTLVRVTLYGTVQPLWKVGISAACAMDAACLSGSLKIDILLLESMRRVTTVPSAPRECRLVLCLREQQIELIVCSLYRIKDIADALFVGGHQRSCPAA